MAKPIWVAIAKPIWVHGFETIFLPMLVQYRVVEVIMYADYVTIPKVLFYEVLGACRTSIIRQNETHGRGFGCGDCCYCILLSFRFYLLRQHLEMC